MDAFFSLRIFTIALCCFLGVQLSAAESSEEPLLLRAYNVPLSFFTKPYPTSKEGKREQLDVKKYLQEQGVAFPPGAEAAYDVAARCLIVRQTAKNLEQVDSLLVTFDDSHPPQVQCEISAYEISSAHIRLVHSERNLLPETLKQLEAKGRLINRLLCVVKSGQIAEATQRGGKERSHAKLLPVIGADGATIDMTLDYFLNVLPEGGKKPMELTAKSILHVDDGHSLIVQFVKNSTSPNKESIVVVLRASILNSCGWPLPCSESPELGTKEP